jgi:hypothetical protein
MVLFLLVWVTFWTIGGIAAASALAYNLAGCETVTLDADALSIRRSIGRLGKPRRYSLDAIRDLRLLEGGKETEVAFTHGVQRVRFGERLDRAAAQSLLDEVAAALPPQPTVSVPADALKTFSFAPTQLEVHRGIGRLRWTRRYDRARIRNVRALPVDTEDGPSDDYFQAAFDYGRRTIRFGGHLTPSEAEALAEDVRARMLLNPAW